MTFRFHLFLSFCLTLLSNSGISEPSGVLKETIWHGRTLEAGEVFVSFLHVIQEGADSSVKKTSAIPAAKPQVGFIKKLFTSATKEEKAAKKEARVLKVLADKQTKIYGWYPYWMSKAAGEIDFNLLTTFSYFSIDAYRDPVSQEVAYNDHGIGKNEMKNLFSKASAAGCRVDVTLMCVDSWVNDQLLNNKTAQDTCISYLIRMLNSNLQFDGLCIVLENIPPNNSGSLLAFISALHKALGPSKRNLMLALPSKDYSNNYDILKLNAVVDSYIIMGYNYYLIGDEAGPVSPLDDHKRNLSIKITVKDYLNKGIPFNKLIFALPYYGVVWKKNNSTGQHSFYKHWTYSEIDKHIGIHKPQILFDPVYCSYYYSFESKGDTFLCYFDNDKSLSTKYKWLMRQGIAGVGIWALGYDLGKKDFWQMIDKNFSVEKLYPLKKEILINKKVLHDTVFTYFLVGDSLVKHTSLVKDTIITDTLFSQIIHPPADSTKTMDESWMQQELGKLKGLFKPLLANRNVASAILITILIFGLLGILGSLLFSQVRELLYITRLPVYILANTLLIFTGIILFVSLGYLKADVNELKTGLYSEIKTSIWAFLILGWILINLLSHKLLGSFTFRYEKP